MYSVIRCEDIFIHRDENVFFIAAVKLKFGGDCTKLFSRFMYIVMVASNCNQKKALYKSKSVVIKEINCLKTLAMKC